MTAGRGGAATAAGAGGAGAAAAGGAGAASGGSSAAAAGSSGAPPASAGAPAPHAGPFTVYLAGDSTVSTYADTARDDDQAGWGQMLSELITPEAHVDNRAIGGRTARRFIDDGRLDEILQDVQTGDYVLVQFGTNDGNRSASYMLGSQTIPYYLEPSTDFKTYLEKYIAGVRDHDAIPVLVTPPPRNSAYCTGGNGTGAHAQAMRELAKADGVILVDLNQKSVDYLKAICPEPSPPNFYLQRADGTVDGTHFQERGARVLAGFVADGLREAGVRFVKPSK
jgi:lysophospholipase L1-like esterase